MIMGIALKFFAGIVMTLLFVVGVPYVTDYYIVPYISEMVGNNTFLFIGSQTLVQILIYAVMIGFILLLGGGAVFRWFGIFGVLGMIVAYYLLGDVTDAFIPVLSIAIVWILFIPLRKDKGKESKR